MHLIERYALGCGVQINKPYIYDKYFPVLVDKYVTLHTTSKESKTYNYWQEVVDILNPIFQTAGIGIVQVGAKDDKPVSQVYSALGQTNINQTAYLIKKGMLHIGVDSFPVHFASYYNKPIVALYSNNYINCVKPYWGDPSKQVLLEGDKQGLKPSFSMQEEPKTINRIPPEKIAKHVCDLLGLSFDYKYETLCIGEHYDQILLEVIPNEAVNPRQFSVNSLVVRMDFHFDEKVLTDQLTISKCSIVTDKPINPNLLNHFKSQIEEIHYKITPDHNPQFVRYVQHIGLKLHLFSFLPLDEVEKLRIHYMDFGLIHPQPLGMPKELEGLDLSKVHYKSGKFTISNKIFYPSFHAIKNNQSIPALGSHLVSLASTHDKDINLLWDEKRHLRFVKEKE